MTKNSISYIWILIFWWFQGSQRRIQNPIEHLRRNSTTNIPRVFHVEKTHFVGFLSLNCALTANVEVTSKLNSIFLRLWNDILLQDVSFNHLGQVLCILLYLRHFFILWYFLKAHSRSEKSFGNCKLFKNDEKCFLFHLKSSFRSIDIQIFILTFWSSR